ncbi:MAG: response regulator [Elusimicrobiales bacterium]|nr:response regulator [Elusimicrobiales bacterium]HOL62453.1 response regulator [Elusimicrobiales bacterium]HPO95255.1 response regulator [Elusimicrobiales bacterium]
MKKILIIEDNKQGLEVLKEVLEHEGYSVVSASDGINGLRFAKKELPDLILLDLLLPKFSGFDICLKLAEDDKTRKIPIIIISTLGEEKSTYEKLKKFEIIKFMKKPYNIEDLLAEIKKTLS